MQENAGIQRGDASLSGRSMALRNGLVLQPRLRFVEILDAAFFDGLRRIVRCPLLGFEWVDPACGHAGVVPNLQ